MMIVGGLMTHVMTARTGWLVGCNLNDGDYDDEVT